MEVVKEKRGLNLHHIPGRVKSWQLEDCSLCANDISRMTVFSPFEVTLRSERTHAQSRDWDKTDKCIYRVKGRWNPIICSKLNGTGHHYIKWNRKTGPAYPYMRELKKCWHEWRTVVTRIWGGQIKERWISSFTVLGAESRVFQLSKSSTSEPRKLYLISAHCIYLINITLHFLYVKLIYGNKNKSSEKTRDFEIPAKISDFYIPSLRHPWGPSKLLFI